MKLTVLTSFLVLVFSQLSLLVAQPSGYQFRKEITIQAAQVGGSHSQFPVLISLMDSDLRTVSEGGHVQNANGYDIAFFLGDCMTPLSYQLEKYVATTGEYVAWVLLPSLDNMANTEINLVYGNSSVASDPSTNSVWSDYGAVWHFSNNSFADASPNGNNGTNSGSTNAAGKIGDCRSFSSLNHSITVPFNNSLNLTTSFTLSAWVNPTVLSSQSGIFSKNNFIADYILGLDWPQGGNNALNCWLYNNGFILYHAGTVQTNQWSHVAATFDGSSVKLFLNGTQIGSTSRTNNIVATSTGLVIGQGNGTGSFNGLIDEPRISPVARDAAWLLTEYNNQNSPASFYAVSAEMPVLNLYPDQDGDTFGQDVPPVFACDQAVGMVPDNSDCDDTNPLVFPQAAELCDGLDNDCNGFPESVTNTWTGPAGVQLSWNDPANWSEAFVPLPCQDVLIPAGSLVKLDAGATGAARTLEVVPTGSLEIEISGTLTIQN